MSSIKHFGKIEIKVGLKIGSSPPFFGRHSYLNTSLPWTKAESNKTATVKSINRVIAEICVHKTHCSTYTCCCLRFQNLFISWRFDSNEFYVLVDMMSSENRNKNVNWSQFGRYEFLILLKMCYKCDKRVFDFLLNDKKKLIKFKPFIRIWHIVYHLKNTRAIIQLAFFRHFGSLVSVRHLTILKLAN